jgi:hypothetical protein
MAAVGSLSELDPTSPRPANSVEDDPERTSRRCVTGYRNQLARPDTGLVCQLVGLATAGSNTFLVDRYSMNSWPATNIAAAKTTASIADAIWGTSFKVHPSLFIELPDDLFFDSSERYCSAFQ